jgi:hypothetical protein
LNVRLLAKAIAGKLRAGSLVADEFLQYAEAIGSLSRDEIHVIGTMLDIGEHTKTLPRVCRYHSFRSRGCVYRSRLLPLRWLAARTGVTRWLWWRINPLLAFKNLSNLLERGFDVARRE